MRDLRWSHVVTIATNTTADARDRYAEVSRSPVAGAPRAAIATRLHQRKAIAITSLGRALAAGIATPIAITRHGIGKQGVEMTGEEAEITEGIEEEMESMRRVEQRVAKFATRRANSPTAPTQATRVDRR
jgi:hypothetical protein